MYVDDEELAEIRERMEANKRAARTHTIHIYFEGVDEPVAVKRPPLGAPIDALHFCKSTCVTKVVIEDDKGAEFTVKRGKV